MKFGYYPFLIMVILLILITIFQKRGNKKAVRILFLIGAVNLLAAMFLPRQLFGKWDAIKQLKGKEITRILLQPSLPGWEVNLTDSCFTISDKKQIDTLIALLHKTEIYSPQHPQRIWEAEMILITNDNDSLRIKINKTENNGTAIYSNDEFRQDQLDELLEKFTNFTKPSLGGKRPT